MNKTILLFLTAVVMCGTASAHTDSMEGDTIVHRDGLGKRLNKKLSKMYYNSKYDTNYVVRPKEKWLLRPMVNMTGNHIIAKGTVNEVWSKYDLRTKRNTTLSLEVNYCDIGAAISFKPNKNDDDYLFGTYRKQVHNQISDVYLEHGRYEEVADAKYQDDGAIFDSMAAVIIQTLRAA